MSPTDPVEEEEKAEAEVEAKLRSEKEEKNLGKVSPKDIRDTHLLPYNAAILDDLLDKMDDPSVSTISYLIGIQKFDQAPWDHEASMSVIPKVIYDQLNHDSLVPTSLHLQLVDQSIWHPVGIVEDIPVRINNSFVPMDFVVLKIDVYRQILLILGRPFLSTTGAMIDVVARIIKLMIKLDRNAMTPDKNFSTKFSRRVKNYTLVATRSLITPAN
jgi:hypothetical protein